jgi:creatine kinase
MDPHLAQNQYPKDKMDVYKKSFSEGGHCSLMARFMNEEMYEKYKDQVSGGNGNWTIARAINTGVMFPRAYMGIHAGDTESYDTYIDIYRPCVEGYHHGFIWDPAHAHRTDLDATHLTTEFTPYCKSIILSTRIRVARNFGGSFTFNPNGTAETRVAVLNTVRTAMESCPDEDLQGRFYVHAEMTPEEEQRLIDEHFLFKGRDQRQAACGYHEYWPAGRGIYQAADKEFNMWINEGDHLRVMVMLPNHDVVGVLSKLARGVKAVEQGIIATTGTAEPFARHPILGMVTCCPTNLGTGCRASVHLNVPLLVSSLGLDGIDKICEENKCQARGSTGEFSDVTQDARVDISNRFRLGYSEVELVEHMIKAANIIAEMEHQLEIAAGAATGDSQS